MSDSIKKAIEQMQTRLQEVLNEAAELKKAINIMSKTIGMEQPYGEEIEEVKKGTMPIRQDQYFRMSLAGAVKEVLKARGQAMNAQEILGQLERGGFDFPENWKKNLRLKNLAISLGKNRVDFVPVPVGNENYFGLWEFYPDKQKEKAKKKSVSNNGANNKEEEIELTDNNNGEKQDT